MFVVLIDGLLTNFPTKLQVLKDSPINKCPKLKPHPKPKTIKELYPDNVDVVLALGDSITAAFGIF